MKYELKISQPEFHEILLLENTKKKSPNTIFCFRFPFIPRIELSRSLISRLSAKCSQIYLNVPLSCCAVNSSFGDDVEGIFGTKKSTANKS